MRIPNASPHYPTSWPRNTLSTTRALRFVIRPSHSYGGSVDLVKGFTKLPKGVGDRIYFSFSAVINARGSGAAYGKLLERVRAVPERRLLVESDQCTAAAVDGGLYDMLGIVAEARGWSVERAAEVTTANFREFYAASLQAMGQEGSNGA